MKKSLQMWNVLTHFLQRHLQIYFEGKSGNIWPLYDHPNQIKLKNVNVTYWHLLWHEILHNRENILSSMRKSNFILDLYITWKMCCGIYWIAYVKLIFFEAMKRTVHLSTFYGIKCNLILTDMFLLAMILYLWLPPNRRQI